MSKTVFLFSGQGSQYKEMGNSFVIICPNSRNILDIGSEITGIDLEKALTQFSDSELSPTRISQPAIFTMSLLALDLAKANGIEFSAVAGHSLGEYAAMVASGVLTMKDGFTAIKHRSIAMERAGNENSGAMAAILGSDELTVAEVCNQIDGYVIPVNFNSYAQTVIAGEAEAVDKAIEKFSEMKKRAIKLAVSSAFHSKLMQSASDEFLPDVSKLQFNTPNVEFYSNIYGDIIPQDIDFPQYLAEHIVSPVKFTSELEKLHQNGYTNFVEIGPNKVLTGLVKKTLKGVKAVNIENEKTLQKALEILQA